MAFIDEKFKERKPEETVALIQEILKQNGIEVTELWHDSGLAHCYSMSLTAHGGIPIANGKGITKALAQASAYGEFIERLQGGLFLSKFQSIDRDPVMNIHTFAPDVKYMTVQELIENGDWMDYIIEEYKNPAITRQSIGRLCKIFDPTPGDKVLTLPFYSLFEKKYVYFPMAFYTQIYGTNGCCAGNTRNEAWVHALSEMMERHASNKMLAGVFSRYYSYGKVSGVPLMGMSNDILACVTRAYAAYRLKLYNDAIHYSGPLCMMDDEDMEQYFSLVNKYLELKRDGVSEEKNRCILRKFYQAQYCDRLFGALDAGKTPYDAYLLKCDLEHCEDCRYREHCAYHANRNMHLRIGEVYKTFTYGQNEAHFAI